MLKRLRSKPSLFPALISGGARRLTSFVSSAPFHNGGQGLKSRNSYISSPTKRMPTAVQWVKLYSTTNTQNSLEFPRDDIDVVAVLKASLPTTVEADDEFDELGPSVSGGSDSNSVLAKNPKDKGLSRIFLKNGSQQAPKACQSQASPLTLPVTRVPSELEKCQLSTHSNLEGQSRVLRSKTKSHEPSVSISIDNIPQNISPLDLEEAISIYGEVQGISLRSGDDGVCSCHVKFKNMRAKKRALAARCITVKNSQLLIRNLPNSLDYISSISIRIANISKKMTEVAIHSICTSYGDVIALARSKEGAIDVVFRVKDAHVSQRIVKHLNDVVIDERRWSAKLLTELDQANTACSSDSHQPVGSQINSHLESLRNRLNMQKIYMEDLENLHNAVLHLRGRPEL